MPSPPLSIIQSLSPRIAVLTSEDVRLSCEANGCRGLEELLRPWEGGTERVSILSSTLTPTIHPTFPLRFVSYDSVYTNPALSAPNPTVLVDIITSHVGEKSPDDEQHYPVTRSLLLSSRPVVPYETFNHPVGVLFAVSTSTTDPLGTLNKLHARTLGPQSVPWLDGHTVLRFYVVVHDVSQMGEDTTPAQELLANVKRAFGPHSTLLFINSQVECRIPPDSPDTSTHPAIPLPRPFTPQDVNPSALSQVYASALASLTLSPMAAAPLWTESDGEEPKTPTTAKPSRRKLYGAKLTAEDTQRLAALVRELVGQSLVPWMEARIREWNEVHHNNRRGITGRLFGAGRKLFSTSRPNSPASTNGTGYNTQAGYYPLSAVESVSRRLADFAFMLRDYRFAVSIYDSLRRDYAQDRAFRYAAAATEMHGLSLLLSHPFFLPSIPPTSVPIPFTNLQHTEITSWLEQSLATYHQSGPASQIQIDALRVTVLYYEAWKAVKEWRGVGAVLVKGAGEADEVPSAVLIEEAALADLRGGSKSLTSSSSSSSQVTGRRRRAFHLVLAARRYETAGLKTFSRRCLLRASENYRAAPWTAAQDRIEYSLGRQAYTLGESDVAVEHFLRLLKRKEKSVSTGGTGSGTPQAGVLEDLRLAWEQLASHPEMLASAKERLVLPTPVFEVKKSQIIIPSSSVSTSSEPDVSREEWLALENEALSRWDKKGKGKKPAGLVPDEKKLAVGTDESFNVQLVANNPLSCPLTLSDLILTFSPSNSTQIAPLPSDIELDAYESRTITISVTASSLPPAGTIKLESVSFMFHKFFPCTETLTKPGKRLHATKAQLSTPMYTEDTSLTIRILPERARVHVELELKPKSVVGEQVFVGEEIRGVLRVKNVGRKGVKRLEMIWNEGVVVRRSEEAGRVSGNEKVLSNKIVQNALTTLHADGISPGEEIDIPIIITPLKPGPTDLFGFIVFESGSEDNDKSIVESTMIQRHLDVQTLLKMDVTIKPAAGNSKQWKVVLGVMNVSAVTVSLERMGGISGVWDVDQKDIGLEILPNQTLHILFPVTFVSPSLDLTQSAVVAALGRLVQGQPLEEVEADLSSTISLTSVPFTGEEAGYLASKRAHRLQYLAAEFSTIPSTSIPNIFPLIDPLELDILLSYSISSRKGCVSLYSLRPSPSFSLVEPLRRKIEAAVASGGKQTRTMYEETGRLRRVLMDSVLEGCLAAEEDPVGVVVEVGKGESAGKGLEHDFKVGPCSVPVSFTIQNRSPYLSSRYILSLPSHSPPSPDFSHTSQSDAPVLLTPRWTGTLSHRGQLGPGESKIVQKEVWLYAPGLMSLRGWEVTVETGDEADPPVSVKGGGEKVWRPRGSWTRVSGERVVEVRQQ